LKEKKLYSKRQKEYAEDKKQYFKAKPSWHQVKNTQCLVYKWKFQLEAKKKKSFATNSKNTFFCKTMLDVICGGRTNRDYRNKNRPGRNFFCVFQYSNKTSKPTTKMKAFFP
jgi:hypothetical protein